MSWTDARALFITKYSHANVKSLRNKEYMRVKQNGREISAFVDDFETTAELAEQALDNELVLLHFEQSLESNFRERLQDEKTRKPNMTFDECREFLFRSAPSLARSKQRTKAAIPNNSGLNKCPRHPNGNHTDSQCRQKTPIKNTVVEAKKNVIKLDRHANLTCHICKIKGHISPNCPSKDMPGPTTSARSPPMPAVKPRTFRQLQITEEGASYFCDSPMQIRRV